MPARKGRLIRRWKANRWSCFVYDWVATTCYSVIVGVATARRLAHEGAKVVIADI